MSKDFIYGETKSEGHNFTLYTILEIQKNILSNNGQNEGILDYFNKFHQARIKRNKNEE